MFLHWMSYRSMISSLVKRFRKTIQNRPVKDLSEPGVYKQEKKQHRRNPITKGIQRQSDLIQTNSRTQSKMRSNGTDPKQRDNNRPGDSLICHQLTSSRVQIEIQIILHIHSSQYTLSVLYQKHNFL